MLFLSLSVASAAGAQTKRPTTKKPTTKKPAAVAYSGPSTQDGVYTNEQANRGKNVYLGSCKSCHSPQSHTGATFNKFWRNHPLSDLFSFVATKMPKNDPGSLAPEDAADVVAYLLKMNAMPVGTEELYPDADSLKQFRIETKRSSSTATSAKRKKP
jgi:cytochrome c